MINNSSINNRKKTPERIEYKPMIIKTEKIRDKKTYENNTYYAKVLSKLFSYNDDKNKSTNDVIEKKRLNNSKNNGKSTNTNSNTNSNASNYLSDYKTLFFKKNSKNSNNENSNSNNNNNNYISPYKTKKITIFASPKNDEIMTTFKDDENGKIVRIVKKRHKSPLFKLEDILPKNLVYQRYHSEVKKPIIKEKVKERSRLGKREYLNTANFPGRGLSALRRINQKIEHYKKLNNDSNRRRTDDQNSLSPISKIKKYDYGKNRQNNLKTFPNVNMDDYHNYNYMESI